MKDKPSPSQVCSCKSTEVSCKHPGQEGSGAPSDVSVKFFDWIGVLDSKLTV